MRRSLRGLAAAQRAPGGIFAQRSVGIVILEEVAGGWHGRLRRCLPTDEIAREIAKASVGTIPKRLLDYTLFEILNHGRTGPRLRVAFDVGKLR